MSEELKEEIKLCLVPIRGKMTIGIMSTHQERSPRFNISTDNLKLLRDSIDKLISDKDVYFYCFLERSGYESRLVRDE